MPDEFDPFQGESGLKDDYEGVITDAFFQKDEQYDRMQLHLKVLADDGEVLENRYACGPDWGSFDGGESVEHPKGAAKGFNNQTAYFQLIKRAFESGAEDELRRRSKNYYGGRGPMYAQLWKGLKFHWGVVSETRNIKDRETGERRDVEMNRIFPDKFVQVVTEYDPAVVPAESVGAPIAATPAAVSGAGPLETIAAPTAAAIRALAVSKPYAEWVDDVMAMTDPSGQPLINNASLMQALGDEGFYNSLKG